MFDSIKCLAFDDNKRHFVSRYCTLNIVYTNMSNPNANQNQNKRQSEENQMPLNVCAGQIRPHDECQLRDAKNGTQCFSKRDECE